MNGRRLILPFPPTLNHNVSRNGKRYFHDKNYDAFIQAVGMIWRVNKPKEWDPSRRFGVNVLLVYNSRRRYDVDNRVKPILDAFTKAGVWIDDSQVDSIYVERGEIDKDEPRAEVTVFPLRQSTFERKSGFREMKEPKQCLKR